MRYLGDQGRVHYAARRAASNARRRAGRGLRCRQTEEPGECVPWCIPGTYKDLERIEELWAEGWMHAGNVAHMDEYGTARTRAIPFAQ